MTHWSDDHATVADLARRARRAVAARIGLEDAAVRLDAFKAFADGGGTQPHVPGIARARAAVRAIGVRRPTLAADLRPLVERLYVLDLLARG